MPPKFRTIQETRMLSFSPALMGEMSVRKCTEKKSRGDCYPAKMLDGAGSTRAMEARLLIDGASFGPDALKAVGQAFDDAWDAIAANFGLDPQAIDAAQLQLANAVLSIADENSRNVDVLKHAALLRMALDYPRARRRGGCSGIPAA